MMKKMKIKNKGFTLVELIIVIAIIAVLAAVLAPRYLQYVERARQSNDLQIATNLMRAATVAVADPKSNVPADRVLEVLWATGNGPDESHYGGKLYIRAPQAVRVSTLSGLQGLEDMTSLTHLQQMILNIMSSDGVTPDFTGSGAVGMMEDAESAVGNASSFCFHIHTTTGEIALAKYSSDGGLAINDWIEVIGVDATPAP